MIERGEGEIYVGNEVHGGGYNLQNCISNTKKL